LSSQGERGTAGSSGTAGDLEALKRFGADAVSFQGLEAAMTWWRDSPAPAGTDAALPYVDSGGSWVAVGTPLVGRTARALAAVRFARTARANGRRAVFFGVECLDPFQGFRRLPMGLQSMLWASRWPATLRASRKLREQVRRARAKGVSVRVVPPDEVKEGTPLRHAVERLRSQWLATKPMEPMGFLVAVEPFHAPEEHLYVVAERHQTAVQFLSAVPIYERRGWLVEDMLRGPDAPNGTTELMLDTLLRTLDEKAHWMTPGLTPLAGAVPWWLQAARVVTTPLYDFGGLRRFRSRLSPSRWDPVWLVWDRGLAPLVLLDVLRAFADGRLVWFAVRSLVRHPNGPPWAVAVPLVAWTLLLAALTACGHASVLGFSTRALTGWIVFDVVLAWLLFRESRRPRVRGLVALAIAAACDALLSVQHLATWGLGDSAASATLRLLATTGPIVGTTALAWAAYRASLISGPRRG
jgi:hypothetical protein